jgi:hypothetical protein
MPAFVSENSKKLLFTLGTAVLGTVGFWVSPLKDKLFHVIYHEKAQILLSADTLNPVEGGAFRLRILLIPQSAIHIDRGFLEVAFDRRTLSLRSGQSSFSTPMIDSPVPIPDEKGVEFLALRPGKAEIKVHLQTKNGNYYQVTSLEIMPSDTAQEATPTNFTGSWLLKIADGQGKMILHQQDWQTIPGSYFLDNGEKGLVYAHHDGKTFGATFIRGVSSATRWYVDETPFSVNPEGYLESTGFAQLQRASTAGWAPSAGKVKFYASVKLR